jgi:subtilisin family serine protease
LYAGLLGDGQIIGIADTGLDIMNSYFYDANNSKPGPYHRKVIYYNHTVQGDTTDCSKGHGTHVNSIAAGKNYKDYGDFKKFNGHAEDAKIAFLDMQKSDSSSCNDPNDPSVQVFPTLNIADVLVELYAQGARIFSNSWGSYSTSGFYDQNARDIDAFIATHPEAIVFFAAGNNGKLYATTDGNGNPVTFPDACPDGSQARTSTCIFSPALAKNTVAVGNNLNDAISWSAETHGLIVPLATPNSLHQSSARGSRYSRIKPDITASGMSA